MHVQVVPAGLLADEELAKLSAHLSNSNTLTPRQRSMLKLSGATTYISSWYSWLQVLQAACQTSIAAYRLT